ncbi:hypothetical protein ACFYYD_13695 [Streptomyces bluensis]|uniref:hypothetical protein n=1 Tax=Streptomyces bluensis TaxID=33897 RepID=UPI003678D185
MTLREFPWLPTGGVLRWVRGMFVTLCAVLAVLVHHDLSHVPVASASATAERAPVASASAMAGHSMHRPTSMPATHTRTDSAADQSTLSGSPDSTACSSMVMQHCSTANVTAVEIAAPSESPIPAVPFDYATVAGADIARSVSRAPPDLSVLSQLRM